MPDIPTGRPLNESWFTLTVAEFIADKERYLDPLDFQREDGWPLYRKRLEIEGILRGYHVPAFLVKKQGDQLPIVDGTQRGWTVVDFFADGFRTFREHENPPYAPIEANKRFSQLSPAWHSVLANSILVFHIMDEMEEWKEADYYLWLQYQDPLFLPDKIWTYPGEPKRQAVKLLDHPFWQSIYHGNQSHRYPFLGCCYIMLLELANSGLRIGTINERRLREFASGVDGSPVNSVLIETIRKRLDLVTHVFNGTSLKSLEEVIPVYQAVGILEEAKVDLERLASGCLTNWYRQVQQKAISDYQAFKVKAPLFKMHSVNFREYFWSEQRPEVLNAVKTYQAGATKEESKQSEVQGINPQRVVDKQKGLCPLCDTPIGNVYGGDYVLQYKGDAPVTLETCAVVHAGCHQKLIQAIPGLELVAVGITG